MNTADLSTVLAPDFAWFKGNTRSEVEHDIRLAYGGDVVRMRKYGIFLDDSVGEMAAKQRVAAINVELLRQGAAMLGAARNDEGITV